MSGYKYFKPCIETHSPLNLVVIMLGTNDTKCYFNANATTIAASAAKIAELALNSSCGPIYGTAPKVLLVSPPIIKNPKFRGLFDQTSEGISNQFAEAFKIQSEAINVEFLNAALYTEADPNDGVHITENSHYRLGTAIANKIQNIFEQK